MDLDPNITCRVCGENDFRLKEGYYYCIECGTKTEQVRAVEVERDDEFDEVKHKKTMKIKTDKSNKVEVTSWECYNYILRGIVEELLSLGAKEELKVTVLQVWAAYLRSMEVAFFSRKHAELPRMGVRFEPRDASILYNHAKERKKAKREEKKTSSIASSKREWRKQIKKLDQSQYEASMSQSICSQSFLSQSSFSQTSFNSSGSAPSNRAIQLKFSNQARKLLKKKMPIAHLKKHENDFNQSLTCHDVRVKARELKYNDAIMELNVKQIFAIISIALNLVEDDIQLTDLMRFLAEGHISAFNVAQFFPENLSEHCHGILSSVRFHMKSIDFSVTNLREQCSLLCKSIHIKSLKLPDIPKLVKRYITELCLPVETYTFIERLINLYPPQMELNSRATTPCYESRAMAYIIFTLKLLFGLDGRKEKKISRSAKKLNNQLASMDLGESEELFVWDDWVEYIEMRKVILCNHSLAICKQFKQIPTRELYLQHLSEKCKVEQKVLSKDQKKKQDNMEIVFQNFLEPNGEEKPTESVGQIKFNASFTPCQNYFNRLQLDPVINATIPDFMKIDHTKRSLLPFLKPKKLGAIFAECGRKLNVVRIACTSHRYPTGTFRNPFLSNLNKYSRKVHFDTDENEWETKIKECKPADGIFKTEMETYHALTLKAMRRKELNRQGVPVAYDTSALKDISCNKSIDLFKESDMEPIDEAITAPRRYLERIKLFDDLSDDETDDTNDVSQCDSMLDNHKTTTFKVSNMDCWLLMGKAFELTEVQTVELKSKLPLTFFWLLETCANTLGVNWTELYDQLMVLETFFAYAIEPLNQFEDRIIFKGEHEIKDINKIVRHFKANW